MATGPRLLFADGSQVHQKRESALSCKLLLGRDDKLGRILAAHAIDCSGCACAYRVGVAAWLLSHNGYRPVRATRNRRTRVKRRGRAEVQDKPGILRRALEGDCGSRLHTEWSVPFGAGDIRRG